MDVPPRLGLAVVGAGRAGRARVRALEESPRARLAALVSRGDAAAPSFEQVLADPAVAGVILCTPNLLHPAETRAALGAGKHVLVEFPLATGPGEARALFGDARARGLVLHEEHIELLSPAQAWLRDQARALGRPLGGELRFSGREEGWLADPALAGSPALCALARLHRVVDLFGEARVRAATLERGRGWRLRVELEFAAGGQLALCETRAPDAARETVWEVRCAAGELTTPPPERPAGLFARDLEVFVERVLRGAPHYVSEARCLHVFELVEAIERSLC